MKIGKVRLTIDMAVEVDGPVPVKFICHVMNAVGRNVPEVLFQSDECTLRMVGWECLGRVRGYPAEPKPAPKRAKQVPQ